MPTFPRPVAVGVRATRWRLSDLLVYEARCAGTPTPELDPTQERFLTARQVAERLGVATSTIWRYAGLATKEASPCAA